MSKYDATFKLKTVEAYLAGEGGYRRIAENLECLVTQISVSELIFI